MTAKEFSIALGQLMGKRYGTLLEEDPRAAPITVVVLEALKTVAHWGSVFTKHAVQRWKVEERKWQRGKRKGAGDMPDEEERKEERQVECPSCRGCGEVPEIGRGEGSCMELTGNMEVCTCCDGEGQLPDEPGEAGKESPCTTP